MRANPVPLTLSRRAFLRTTALGAAGGALLATGIGSAAAALSVAHAQTATSAGELRIAVASFPNTLDALKVRAGAYKNFTRIVFDWKKNVSYAV